MRRQRIDDVWCGVYRPGRGIGLPRADPRVYNQTVITDRWRYTCYPNEPSWGELFDLESDPWEHRNLFGEPGLTNLAAGLRGTIASQLPSAPDAGETVLGAY